MAERTVRLRHRVGANPDVVTRRDGYDCRVSTTVRVRDPMHYGPDASPRARAVDVWAALIHLVVTVWPIW